ncbi:integrating conjugative element protein, PFL_4693 family [Vibrio xiamenensis]|uniref:Integrating conjugative element protein, PFL_4693 family n=1 Tax=Vibrio xiamenensis TaxID=861298 RepID=A0A1G8CHA1_9VIBR|nr:hypothetical protein [Vibrio xiamenensis]SDH44837.1 integrating conjugative element protein, PFL_4693 family [Vibrio xiamenensis]
MKNRKVNLKPVMVAALCSMASMPILANSIALPRITTDHTQEQTASKNMSQEATNSEFERKSWGLSEKEWETYKHLTGTNNPISQYLSIDTASPYRVLYSAESDQKQKYKYAELELKYMKVRMEEDRQYMLDMIIVGNQIMPAEPTAAKNVTLNSFGPIELTGVGEHITVRSLLFVDGSQCDSKCIKFVNEVIASTGSKGRVDIVLIGEQRKEAMLAFAKKAGITNKHVETGAVGIIPDNGKSEKLRISHAPVSITKDVFGGVRASNP